MHPPRCTAGAQRPSQPLALRPEVLSINPEVRFCKAEACVCEPRSTFQSLGVSMDPMVGRLRDLPEHLLKGCEPEKTEGVS